MDNPATTTTDDAELAKVLESMNENAAAAVPPADSAATSAAPVADDATTPAAPAEPQFEMPTLPPIETEVPTAPVEAAAPVDPALSAPVAPVSVSPELESIKKDAVEELRPLVDKLDLPADEKFDTLLLIIRSTDDKALIGPAHEAAKAITDETKRAQALLDVIKEIDYFSNPGTQQ